MSLETKSTTLYHVNGLVSVSVSE